MKFLTKCLLFFIFPVFCFSLLAESQEKKIPHEKENYTLNDIDFYEGFGRINETFEGDGNRFIICIQDTHCNFESQQNTAEIMNSLNKRKKIPLIVLEGASGGFDLTLY